jgi:uncharacterized protein YoxC
MQDPWTVVGVVLLGVLVGAVIPVLFQLYSTLRVTRNLLARLGPKVDGTLAEVREASRRLNRVGSSLEQSTKRVQILLEAVGDIGDSVGKLRDSLKTATAVGASLGPAIAAAIGALSQLRRERADEETGEPPESEAGEDE